MLNHATPTRSEVLARVPKQNEKINTPFLVKKTPFFPCVFQASFFHPSLPGRWVGGGAWIVDLDP
jgi:hypothetical protein